MTGSEIIRKAQELQHTQYWYGAKGQKATIALANQLRRQYPSIWTNSYYKKAIKSVNRGTIVGDCSYLVCKAYGIAQIGSYQIRERYPVYNINPKIGRNGMILWRPGHVGIFYEGQVIALRGIDYGYNVCSLNVEHFTYVLCDMSVDYTK